MTAAEAPPAPVPEAADRGARPRGAQVVPQSVISRQLANPFLAPDYSAAAAAPPRRRSGCSPTGS